MSEINYAKFWGMMKYMRGADKGELVKMYTKGRTEHLHEMTKEEYTYMVKDLWMKIRPEIEESIVMRELKRLRSHTLHQMQLFGINTADWHRVNAFCKDKRICGKAFSELSGEELEELRTKVIIMIRKAKEADWAHSN